MSKEVTHQENYRHSVIVLGKNNIGRFIGERNGNHKITEQEAEIISCLLKQGQLTQQQIADKFNISRRAVGDIKSGRTWRHIR